MSEPLRILYENHRGETRERTLAAPIMIFRESRWHDGTRWLISALDTESNAMRDFAVSGIRSQAQAARIAELEAELAAWAEFRAQNICEECKGEPWRRPETQDEEGEPLTFGDPETCELCDGTGMRFVELQRLADAYEDVSVELALIQAKEQLP